MRIISHITLVDVVGALLNHEDMLLSDSRQDMLQRYCLSRTLVVVVGASLNYEDLLLSDTAFCSKVF